MSCFSHTLLSVYLTLWVVLVQKSNQTVSVEHSLMDFVLDGYVSTVRPVKNFSTPVNVTIDIGLHQLIDLNEKEQVLTTNLWMRLLYEIMDVVDQYYFWLEHTNGGILRRSERYFKPPVRFPSEEKSTKKFKLSFNQNNQHLTFEENVYCVYYKFDKSAPFTATMVEGTTIHITHAATSELKAKNYGIPFIYDCQHRLRMRRDIIEELNSNGMHYQILRENELDDYSYNILLKPLIILEQ